MNQRIDLSAGAINGSDRLVVELIEPLDTPPIMAINWPAKPTVATRANYPAVAAAITRMIAEIRHRPGAVEGARQVNQP